MAVALRLVLVAALTANSAVEGVLMLRSKGNPIRKVVTMLQKIQQKVEAEGEKELELHYKYMCYCRSNIAEKTQAISDAEAKLESIDAGLKGGEGQKLQLVEDLKNHKADRLAAKEALAEAEAMREKEAKAYAGVKAEAEANMEAVAKAVAAINKGSGGAFLQTDSAEQLRQFVQSNEDMDNKEEVMSFLSNEDESAGGGEIVGILKTLSEEMGKDLSEATSAETKAISNFNDLTAAKKSEVAALTAAIEDKIARQGEIGVAIADLKNDGSDTADQLAEDKLFLADLQKTCEKKVTEWDAISVERKGELVALADTIKMLNDDDALELFKKTLPSSASSFLQIQVTSAEVKARALAGIHKAQKKNRRPSRHLDLVALMLHAKTSDFSKVIAMIDEMSGVLKSEGVDDEKKKEYCTAEIDATEDKLKGFTQMIKDSQASIADAKETSGTLGTEIQTLVIAIQVLDMSVAKSTDQRKKENAVFKALVAQNAAAKELISMAKERLNKFYKPHALVQEDEEAAPAAESFMQVKSVESQADDDALMALSVPEAPAAAPALFQSKKKESGGVIAMLDVLIGDLEKETAVANVEEKDAQADYETFIADSKTMRTENTKSLGDKEAAKADSMAALQGHTDDMEVSFKKMKGANDQLKVLHKDCDWLLQNFDTRKEARADELDALGKAKAVLSGADL
jgi:hypothetical protein